MLQNDYANDRIMVIIRMFQITCYNSLGKNLMVNFTLNYWKKACEMSDATQLLT